MRGVAVFAFLLTLASTPIVIAVLRRLSVLDVPGARSSHSVVTPRGGGIAVLIGAVGGLLLATIARVPDPWSLKTLIVCASFFALIGLIDDIRTLEVRTRLAAQFGCSAVFVGSWFFANAPVVGVGLKVALVAAAVVWIVGYLNAFNFMDGINGISALHAIVAGGTFFLIGRMEHVRILQICGVAIAAAAAGFLPYNFPRAKVFLGDVGSYFIGTWLAMTALIAVVWQVPPEAALAPFLVYLADTSVTLARRIRRGANWRESHREHVYQQLTATGWSHTRTAVVVTAFSAVCAALGLASLSGSLTVRLAADAAMVLVVAAYVSLPMVVRSSVADLPVGPGTDTPLNPAP